MQTFLPYASYEKSLRCLDQTRLGKQRTETYQIAKILSGLARTKAWSNHTAVLQWQGYLPSLIEYGLMCCSIWKEKGFADTVYMKLLLIPTVHTTILGDKPYWLGDERYHSSHRANLLRKDFNFYSKYSWNEDPTTPYFWPTPQPI